jgi:hypothetical protein
MGLHDASEDTPIFCVRCGAELKPGTGNFYLVRIEAFADPSPPEIAEEDLRRDHRAEIKRLIDKMRDLSEQELTDQVHRRVILHLCGPCYWKWIEDPVR